MRRGFEKSYWLDDLQPVFYYMYGTNDLGEIKYMARQRRLRQQASPACACPEDNRSV